MEKKTYHVQSEKRSGSYRGGTTYREIAEDYQKDYPERYRAGICGWQAAGASPNAERATVS